MSYCIDLQAEENVLNTSNSSEEQEIIITEEDSEDGWVDMDTDEEFYEGTCVVYGVLDIPVEQVSGVSVCVFCLFLLCILLPS